MTASTMQLSGPSLRFATRRAGAPQRPAVLVQSCRPRYGSNPFFTQGMPFMGGNAWQQQQQRGGNPQAWQELFKMAEKAFGPESQRQWQQAAEGMAAACSLPVDIVESETEYVLTADIPGLAKGDLKIRVKEETRELTISGERRRGGEPAAASSAESKEEPAAADAFQGRRTYERRMGKFERTFKLSEKADPNAISARVEKGVLTLTILKKERDEPQVKEVPIWD